MSNLNAEPTTVILVPDFALTLRKDLTTMQLNADDYVDQRSSFKTSNPKFNFQTHSVRGLVQRPGDNREISFLLPRRGRRDSVQLRFANNTMSGRPFVEIHAFDNFGVEHFILQPVRRADPKLTESAAQLIIVHLRDFIDQSPLVCRLQIRPRARAQEEGLKWQDVESLKIR